MPAPEAATDAAAAADLALLKDAAREAAGIAMRYFRRNPQVWMKAGTSPVSEADFAVDRFLRKTLIAARPDYGWLSEETADTPARLESRRTFIVDPIDGTRAFIDGRDHWCISVAVVEAGRSIAGVLDCPARDEVFAAARGEGAWLNGRSLRVRVASDRLDVGGPRSFIDALGMRTGETVRRVGYVPSLAYRIAMVADGRIDATFIKPNAHDWDLAAADLVLGEAGGAIRDGEGRPLHLGGADPSHDALAAGSGALLERMTRALGQG